jgi:hypothetical protein
MMNSKAMNTQIELALGNRDYQMVMQKATRQFRQTLDEDSLEICKLHGLWHSLETFKPEFNVKFTTYLFKGVFIECVKASKFQKRHTRYTRQMMHNNLAESDRGDFAMVDLQDEINHSSDPEMLRERAAGATISEISASRSVSRETVRKKIKKMSRTIERRYL